MSKLLNKLNDLSKITRRAAFSDMEHQIKKYKYGSDAFMQILESRYSCHAFTHHPVSDAKLQMILDAGRMAPSAANLQPTRIWVVKSEEALAKLHQVHPCYGAPVVLIVGSSAAGTRKPGCARTTASTPRRRTPPSSSRT